MMVRLGLLLFTLSALTYGGMVFGDSPSPDIKVRVHTLEGGSHRREYPLLLEVILSNRVANSIHNDNQLIRDITDYLESDASPEAAAKLARAQLEGALIEQALPTFRLGSPDFPVEKLITVKILDARAQPVRVQIRSMQAAARNEATVILAPDDRYSLFFGLDVNAVKSLSIGTYTVQAVLNTSGKSAMWQGELSNSDATFIIENSAQSASKKAENGYYYLAGKFYWYDKSYDSAKKYAQKILSSSSEYLRSDAWALLGDIAQSQGDAAQAREHYDMAISVYNQRADKLRALIQLQGGGALDKELIVELPQHLYTKRHYARDTRVPNDPLFHSSGSWGQKGDDQWALKQIGFTPGNEDETSAWHLAKAKGKPVIVAVVDTGIDYFHPDIERKNIWQNSDEIPNGLDDDDNGYIDDMIGWNFVEHNNNPIDRAGHGTHVAGVIAAAINNDEGIAGINSEAIIMPLKALNFVGRGQSSGIAEAIYYAVANGAKIINLSLGGDYITRLEQEAVAYAVKKGLVVVVASGNIAADTSNFGFASLPSVITVASTDQDNNRSPFSNWGEDVNLAAPGEDILSLRAMGTDLMTVSRVEEYTPGSYFVGVEDRYYRASGTSFAAPLVSGVASVLFSLNPSLTAEQVTRMIINSAEDIDAPGIDRYTGYGLLNARKAITANPDYFITASIDRVEVIQVKKTMVLRVVGQAGADDIGKVWIDLGKGNDPEDWERAAEVSTGDLKSGNLADIDVRKLQGTSEWTIRLTVEHRNGSKREFRHQLSINT